MAIGVTDIFVYIRTLQSGVIIHSTISPFSSFIRIAFYKAAILFIFLGMSDQSVIDAVARLLTSMNMSEINDLLALSLFPVDHLDSLLV